MRLDDPSAAASRRRQLERAGGFQAAGGGSAKNVWTRLSARRSRTRRTLIVSGRAMWGAPLDDRPRPRPPMGTQRVIRVAP